MMPPALPDPEPSGTGQEPPETELPGMRRQVSRVGTLGGQIDGGSPVQKRRWKDLTAGQRAVVLTLGAIQLLLAASAWTDLARRPPDQVNGTKGVWAAIIAVNWIGPLAWYRWGKRGSARPG
jgi:hypothetical protein